ncbi:hypothetical protein AH2_00016 [Burkholderia phage vB_BceS_AH2]|uniref:Uncharacterized protein n=1 Tax=Burkholderia phage vB_BceS_AH2 TaxID=1133022 RepID=I6NSS4_9CAUD|nr:hypothetical protein B613_gp16 [Burkholderia phage vB_BceS_AH2]AEY69561.1 hypothetical protein AH2_00016 [Burkholderia phage vB_BceS_AH2]
MHDLEEPGGFRPHRQVNHGTDSLKKANINKMHCFEVTGTPGMAFLAGIEDRGDRYVFRIPQKLTVEFYTRKNRWRVRGQKKTTHGTIEQFMQWFETQLKVPA